MLAATVVAVGGPGYAASSDSGDKDAEEKRELATVAGQALASIGGFSAGLFGRMHGEGDKAGFAGCFTKTGDMDDLDEDRIPDDVTIELENCPSRSAFGIGTVSGSMHIRDEDREDSDGAFEADVDLTIEATESQPFDWSKSTTRLDGTFTGHGRTAEAVLDQDLHVEIDLERNGESHQVESDTMWRVAFNPDEGWDVGTPNAPGDVLISGTWNFDIDGNEADANVETLRALRLGNTDCQFGADAGVLSAEFGAEDVEHTMNVTWTGCNSSLVDVEVADTSDDDEEDEDED